MVFRKLFEIGKIGGMVLQNRIVMAPMGTGSMQNPDGGFSERLRDYFKARAKGGVGLIMTGATLMTRVTKAEGRKAGNTLFLDATFIGGASELCDVVHQHGAKICIQLTPGEGRLFSYLGEIPLAPSDDLRGIWNPKIVSRAATKEEIGKIIRDYKYVARLAKMAGFDAIEIRAYGGYFVDQFMSSVWNKRTDEYGGDLDGRLRFLMEAIAAVRSSLGRDYPLIVKFTPAHYMEGGRELDEGIEIAIRLEQAGVDALHVDMGCYEVWYHTIPPVHMPLANQLHLAEAVRKAVNIPVISNGNLGIDPQIAEKALQDEKIDFIALGRPLLADPEWARKVESGRLEEIKPCIGCLRCLKRIFEGKYISCAVNPQTGMEKEYQLTQAEHRKSVLVVGGGPGGMEASTVAALRGHHVTLCEKKDVLGGALRVASVPSFKRRMERLIDYYSCQLLKLGVNIELNREIDPETILKTEVDALIIAVGANLVFPDGLAGLSRDRVHTAESVLLGESDLEQLGKRIAIVGGGETGCEIALYLAERGDDISIFIVEMLDGILSDTFISIKLLLEKKLKENGIQVLCNAKLAGIGEGVLYIEQNDSKREIGADSVILAAGYHGNTHLWDKMKGNIGELYPIGDCNNPRAVMDAIWEGFHAARMI
jgi:2-enoate reductase